MQITPDASGNFAICPVPAGTYDVVAVALSGAGVSYAATITTGVSQGTALGKIPMIAVTGTSTAPGAITGLITTANPTPAGTVADLTLSALQMVGSVQITIPLAQQQSATASVSTASGMSCPATTDCVNYTLSLPGVNPTVGAFSSSGTTYTAGAAGAASYVVEAKAFVPSSGGKTDCSSPTMTTPAVSVSPGSSTAAANLTFTGCQ